MKTTRWIAVPLGVLLCALPAGAGPRVKITLGKDTTRITGPVRPDGTIDYLAAVNKRASKGVTKDNNAAVGFLQVIGTERIPKDDRDRISKALGTPLPAEGTGFEEYKPATDDFWSIHERLLRNPWRPQDHPDLVKWIEANRKPLAAFVAASKRPHFYMPRLGMVERAHLFEARPPTLWPLSAAARCLGIRASLAIGQGRIDDAWRDILATHRVGNLLGQDPELLERLMGLGICERADKATVNLAACGKLSAARVRAILADLDAIGPGPKMISVVDGSERFWTLDIILDFAANPMKLYNELEDENLTKDASSELVESFLRGYYADVDFNDILRRANAFYDSTLAAMRKPTYAEQTKAAEAVEARLDKIKKLANNPAADKPVGKESVKTRVIGTRVLAVTLHDLFNAQRFVERAKMRYQIARLALALAAYRAEKGEYPSKLAAVAPAYVKAVPRDFFSGKALIYKRQGAGYLLYSVGWNTRDDGGVYDRRSDPPRDDLAARAER